jgi:hypothetical protein
MSLTDNNLVRSLANESTSVMESMGKGPSILTVALLAGALIGTPAVLEKEHDSSSIIGVTIVHSYTAKVATWTDSAGDYFTPRTSLGRKLLEIRKQAIARGLSLMHADDIILELSRRRGELFSA